MSPPGCQILENKRGSLVFLLYSVGKEKSRDKIGNLWNVYNCASAGAGGEISNFDLWGGVRGPLLKKVAPYNPHQNLSDKGLKHSRNELQILICGGVYASQCGVTVGALSKRPPLIGRGCGRSVNAPTGLCDVLSCVQTPR